MFGALTDKLQDVFSGLLREKKLTESNVADAVREVRLALLEADVNYSVAKTLVKRLKEEALGDEVLKAVSPGQQFVKIVHDELAKLMGAEESDLVLDGKPSVIMMCGLQGSGKTTHSAKIAHYLRRKGKAQNPMLVACDLQRPAAIQQLQTLGEQVGVSVFTVPGEQNPVKVVDAALKEAKKTGCDVVILDTAGRLHIDEELMQQLEAIRNLAQPQEVLFVANATTGQDAVTTAAQFNERVAITGSILTMLDGNARGGAAISIREVTGKPLKFEGVGEKVEDLQPFNPTSMADRILGMGDTINLVRKAEEHISEEDAEKMANKLRKAAFTYEDYLSQMQMIKKMGPLKGLLKMIPGLKLPDADAPEREMRRVEAIIRSMTHEERREECQINPPRRKRIARGSGTNLDDVNKLIKSFKQMKQMMKKMPNKKQMEKMMGGSAWR